LQGMRAAADRENATEKATVTPGPIIPARELLGEMLLAVNEPQPALQAFEASMQIEPNRFWGLYGAARAAELAGDRDKARTYYTQLLALAKHADSERPGDDSGVSRPKGGPGDGCAAGPLWKVPSPRRGLLWGSR
jgi:tetratricopeptide (TPR) repeat protein